MNTAQQPPKSRILRKQTLNLGFDIPLLLVMLVLIVFGAMMLFSASFDYSLAVFDNSTQMFSRQMTWLALGVVAAVAVALIDYHYWRVFAVTLLVLTIIGLLVVLIFGEARYGAVRSLTQGSLMPSELAKLSTIIYLAVWLYAKRNQISDITFGLAPMGVIVGVMAGLIMLQPDFSAAATIIFIGGIMFFLTGGDIKQLLILLGMVFSVGWAFLQIYATGSQRIESYMAGLQNPLQSSYHVLRSIEAFVKGGFFGVGIGRGDTKFLGLPVPPTDSIFAVVAEETGWIGAALLVLLFGLLLWRGIAIATRAPDLLGTLLASGLTVWIVLEAYINMGVMVGLVPFAGNALPFVSAGGSNLVVSLIAVGIIFSVDRLSRKEVNEQGVNTVYAFDGVRRSERRRGVSRPSRVAGAERDD